MNHLQFVDDRTFRTQMALHFIAHVVLKIVHYVSICFLLRTEVSRQSTMKGT